MKARSLLAATLGLAVLTLACADEAQHVFDPGADTPLLAKDKGCPESGHPSCGNDDPAGTTTLDFADGMQTAGFAVSLKERSNLLRTENTDFAHDIQMNFLAPGTCVGFKGTKSGVLPTADEVTSLEAELVRLVTGGYFIMDVDMNGLAVGASTTSETHFLDVERDGTFAGDAGSTRVLLGSPFNQVDPVSVEWVSSSESAEVFEFTGPLVVWASKVGGGGGAKTDRIIQCSGTGAEPNKVTVTVNR